MRYAIFSDVHGNLEALAVVLEHLKSLQPDAWAFVGDAVGYGANPNEVCDLIRALDPIAVVGNHDAAVAGRMDYADYYNAARHALDWCAQRITPENLAWLRQLPYTQRLGPVAFCHGSPVVPELFDYLFTAQHVEELLDSADDTMDALAPVTFIGHSHLTVSFRIDVRQARVTSLHESRIFCDLADPTVKHIITVGSVGQPRDRDPRTCAGCFDTTTGIFELHRLEYDVHTARQKILDAGLAPIFGERLLVGV